MVTGSFSPFFNVYFSQYIKMPVEQIGTVFSISNLVQVVAILGAPVILRKFGLVSGTMYMQIATAIALMFLAAARGPHAAGIIYVGFMAVQWMSEPGMETLPHERNGAGRKKRRVSVEYVRRLGRRCSHRDGCWRFVRAIWLPGSLGSHGGDGASGRVCVPDPCWAARNTTPELHNMPLEKIADVAVHPNADLI